MGKRSGTPDTRAAYEQLSVGAIDAEIRRLTARLPFLNFKSKRRFEKKIESLEAIRARKLESKTGDDA